MKKLCNTFSIICCMLTGGFVWAEDISSASAIPKGILSITAYPAPSLELNDIDGNPFSLAQKKGHWIFVHFWASWCGPCRREMPAIQNMVEKLKTSQLVFAIVNTAENEDTVFTFLGLLAPDIVSLMDLDGQVTEAWQPRGLPSTYLVDPDGIVRYQALGGRPWDEEAYLRFLEALSVQPARKN
ncbi:MAG: TlpA family protein disulfide reductase [Gammaproteobacteria bacterium]|nr:TlpA family protein disulfide reductase [Gammaproteobacteria bacterium]